MKKLTAFFSILTIFLIYTFLNLGNYLDVTEKPSKTDLIVSLGGGTPSLRINKTIQLYKNNFLEKDFIVFTGVKTINKKYYNQVNTNIHIITNDKVKNTMEEVLYIKDFIKENNISSVIFVTDAPHSRRVKFFWDTFGENLSDISFSIVASDLTTWNSSKYYENDFSLKYAFSELTKLVYNSILYGVLEKLGFKEEFELNYKKELREMKKELSIKLN